MFNSWREGLLFDLFFFVGFVGFFLPFTSREPPILNSQEDYIIKPWSFCLFHHSLAVITALSLTCAALSGDCVL